MKGVCMKETGNSKISPVRIYEEPELLRAREATRGYCPISRIALASCSFSDILGNAIGKAEKDAFERLKEYASGIGGNVALVRSRHLSGLVNKQLELVADVYRIE